MPKKSFNNPLDDDVWDQLDTNDSVADPAAPSLDFDSLTPAAPPAKSKPASSAPQPQQKRQSAPQRSSMDETLFFTTHGRNSKKKRPMVGNYQFVNLLVRADVAEYLREAAIAHRMDLAPFMRWVIDQFALMYDDGLRPEKAALDESGKKVRLQALVAPVMHDVLRAWADENRVKFQTFMRWALFEFTAVYEEHQLAPQEPEEFLPGEAMLFHWASTKVQKYYGSGLAKDQRDE